VKTFLKILLIIITFNCCNTRKKSIESVVLEWYGKEIILPQQIEYRILGRDTICSDFWNKPYKILTYVDSVGCSSCQIGLIYWKEIIKTFVRQQLDVSVLFVIHSSDYDRLDFDLTDDNFNYPVIYDHHNLFDKLNHFPPTPYRTFLLDKDNKVLLIGSPIDSSQMWELYMKTIIKMQ